MLFKEGDNLRTRSSVKINPLLIAAGLLIIVIVLRFDSTSLFASVSPTLQWNTQIIDAAKNGNAFLALYSLEETNNTSPVNALVSDILTKPSIYIGKYLQLSGTIQSVQIYPRQNNLFNLIINNAAEVTIVGNDGGSLVDCLLVNGGTNLTIGNSITIAGYTPGIRSIQNSQGAVIPELVFIGREVW